MQWTTALKWCRAARGSVLTVAEGELRAQNGVVAAGYVADYHGPLRHLPTPELERAAAALPDADWDFGDVQLTLRQGRRRCTVPYTQTLLEYPTPEQVTWYTEDDSTTVLRGLRALTPQCNPTSYGWQRGVHWRHDTLYVTDGQVLLSLPSEVPPLAVPMGLTLPLHWLEALLKLDRRDGTLRLGYTATSMWATWPTGWLTSALLADAWPPLGTLQTLLAPEPPSGLRAFPRDALDHVASLGDDVVAFRDGALRSGTYEVLLLDSAAPFAALYGRDTLLRLAATPVAEWDPTDYLKGTVLRGPGGLRGTLMGRRA